MDTKCGWLILSSRSVAVLALCLVLSSCNIFGFREWSWHQKITVAVNTPSGMVTASSVGRSRMTLPPKWWGVGDAAGSSTVGFSGEAVVLNLGQGRYLFALIDQEYEPSRALKAFGAERLPSREDVVQAVDRVSSLRASVELPQTFFPKFVTFDDINNSATVRTVNPYALPQVFGPGFELSSVSMAITNEEATSGVVGRTLKWLKGADWLVPPAFKPRALKDQTEAQQLVVQNFATHDLIK